MSYLLDTNIVSFAMRGNLNVLERLQLLNLQGISVSICAITYFEIRRGLLAKNALIQMKKI